MQVDKLTNGRDPGIDELLNQSFLDLDQNNPVNDQLFDMASQNVFGTEWPGEVNAQKEAQFTKVTRAPKWQWYLSGIGAVGIIATATVFFSNNSNNEKIADSNQSGVVSVFNSNENTFTQNSPLTANAIQDEKQENKTAQNETDADQIKKNGVDGKSRYVTSHTKLIDRNTINAENSNSQVLSGNALLVDPNNESNTANGNAEIKKVALPMMTEEQKEETKKEIQKLVYETTSNFVYNYVPISGAAGAGYNHKAWQSSFNLKTTEVTVKEYMLFLNDLVMKGRADEYEKARPKVEEVFGSNMSAQDKKFFNNYFTSSHFKNYPIVFITPEAANLYCEWLQQLIISNSKGKFQTVEVRLPFESEWERAATGGNNKAEIGTKSGKIRNGLFNRNKPVDANYKATQKSKFTFLDADNEQLASVEGDLNAKDNFNYFTCNVRSYDANGYGLYNMSGNVSEMVVNKSGKVMTKGGNWNSPIEYLKIKDPDFIEFPMGAEASPYIGFRPVINFK